MNYKKRAVEQHLKELCNHFPVIAVLGARQVGKTTLVKQLFENDYKTITFDPVQDIGQARQDPDLFLANNPGKLFLDEVQYAPELLATLKRDVDQNRTPGRYILSGSQNLAVVKNISESLAGRVAIIELPPLSFKETAGILSESFLKKHLQIEENHPSSPASETPWNQTIFRGGMPGTLELPNHLLDSYFSGYLQTYIERDIRTISDIGNLQVFSNFYRLLGALSSTEINSSQIGRDLSIDRRTAIAWKDILQATYQWKEIPAFTRNPVKRITSKNKGVFTDTGMMCYLQRITSPEMIASHPLQGRLTETWVINEILRICNAWPQKPAVYHYRSARGAEVDIILEMNGRLYPIEIKAKSHPSKRDTSGIRSFREAFPNERIEDGLLVCAITNPIRISENVIAIPWNSL